MFQDPQQPQETTERTKPNGVKRAFSFTKGQVGSVYSMHLLHEGMINILARTEQEDTGLHHSTHSGTHLKTYELFVSANVISPWLVLSN